MFFVEDHCWAECSTNAEKLIDNTMVKLSDVYQLVSQSGWCPSAIFDFMSKY